MRLRALISFVARDLRRSMRTFWVAGLGIAAGVATLAFFLALSAGIARCPREDPAPRPGGGDPPESSFRSVFSMLGGRPPGIDDAQAQALRRADGVRMALPRLRLAFPTSGRGGRAMFGRDIGSGEIPADGVDPSMVRADLRPGPTSKTRSAGRATAPARRTPTAARRAGSTDLVALPRGQPEAGALLAAHPAVVSPYLVEVFNGTIAPGTCCRGLVTKPRRVEAEGLVLGVGPRSRGLRQVARQGTPGGCTASSRESRRERWTSGDRSHGGRRRLANREYAGEAAQRDSSVVVPARPPGDDHHVAAQVRAQGLEVQTRGAEQMGLLATAR
ncbi:MAG: hypothetical protein IPN17_15920 [Deltaproteobacteria bacterium]|nr:hypothetical protein [Deltaproteobacteria bacterium]